MVEERCDDTEAPAARRGGVVGSENVGISNYYAGENPARRKSKVSWAMMISPGLAGPNPDAQRYQGMDETVDIPSPPDFFDGTTEDGRKSWI